MRISDVREVKKCRKSHICDWCGQVIEEGTSYSTWFTFGEACTARIHPECFSAMQDAMDYDEELPPRGTYRRGCACGENEENCECDYWVEEAANDKAE